MSNDKEQLPAEVNQHGEKNDVFENYLLLGAPRSGKTTFFCCMADHLQTLATESGRFGFKFCDNHTSRFIRGQMKLLRNGSWPVKSPKKDEEDYLFQLDYDWKLFGIKFYKQFVDIIFHDYPGEAFNDAFSDTPSGRYENDVKDLRAKIALAKGIFLMLDVKEIFNENNVEAFQEALVEMIKYLRNNKKKPPKLALIFNKTELITNYSHDKYVRKFKRLFSNAVQYLSGIEHKYFSVYTIGGECRISDAGVMIPPAELRPRQILKPVNWMIHFI